jgi:methyltransferase (TIGR00027 family)
MRAGIPSFTAMIVAGARAAAGVDPCAERLVPQPFGAAFAALRRSRVARALSLGLVDHLALRTQAIVDTIVEVAAPQLVVLGAGLDARAHRMDALAETVVFEVDHPATQAFKRERAETLRRAAREVRYVGVDFERDDLGERLGASGHDATRPTTWIWEGVTPYLTEDAVDATLGVIRARTAEGSALVMTYGTPDLGTVPRVLRPLVPPAFRLLGENLRGLMTTARAHALVRAHGFEVTSDEGIDELARRYGRREPPLVIAERVLVAR